MFKQSTGWFALAIAAGPSFFFIFMAARAQHLGRKAEAFAWVLGLTVYWFGLAYLAAAEAGSEFTLL